MGNFYENRAIACLYCRYSPIQGRESTFQDRRGIVTECRWICPKCNRLVRCDEKVEPKKIVKKQEKEQKKESNEKKK